MAPSRAAAARRSTQTSEHIYNLGERGRKTGVVLHDTGMRDEHGMEPIDDIFSSPTRSRAGDEDEEEEEGDEEEAEEPEEEEEEEEEDDDDDDGGEADMDLTTGSGLDPAALINGQKSGARFGARRNQQQQQQQQSQQSPAKSLFGSPAVRGAATQAAMRQNPLLRPPSSPENVSPQDASSPSKPVKRRLDFGKNGNGPANGQRRPLALAASNGPVLKPTSRLQPQDDEPEPDAGDYDNDESMNMVGGTPTTDQLVDLADLAAGEEQEQEEEPEPEPEPAPKRRAGRPPKAKPAAEPAAPAAPAPARKAPAGPQQNSSPAGVAKKAKRGRPPRQSDASDTAPAANEEEAEPQQPNTKRQRLTEAPPPAPKRKAGRPPAAAKAAAASEPAEEPAATAEPAAETEAEAPPRKKTGRKRKSSGVGAATAAVAAVPRGPPLPKSRGLVVRRRELAEDSDSVTKTRSGRNSFRPLAFWRNEHVELDPTDVQRDALTSKATHGPRSFLLPSVREIVRVDEEVLAPMGHKGARGGAKRAAKPKRRRSDDVNDDGDDADNAPQREPWETESGKVSGEIVVWYPEHEFNPPAPGQDVEMMTAEIALSSAAIRTNDVRGATFRFVKTLSLPFFGTGMVDLAPGAEKKLKNSRKMHMTFFVHYGLVSVKVNDTEFSIGKGGMWSVPRGNYYSVKNNSDHEARVFFAQGCEILTTLEDEEEGGE